MSACASCKKGKRKCDGASPCSRCVALERECVKIAPKKRGRPSSSNGVVESLKGGVGDEVDRLNGPVVVKKSQQKLLSIILASEHAMVVRPRDLVGTFGLDLGETYFGVQFPDIDFKMPNFDDYEEVFRVYTPIICKWQRKSLSRVFSRSSLVPCSVLIVAFFIGGGRVFVAQSGEGGPVLHQTVGRRLSEVLVEIQTAEDRDDPRARRLMEAVPGAPSIKRLETGVPRAVRLGGETFLATGRSIWFFNEQARPVLSFICLKKVELLKKEPRIEIFLDDDVLPTTQNPFYVDGWGMDGVFDIN